MLLDAQNKAAELFAEIERSGMIRARRPGAEAVRRNPGSRRGDVRRQQALAQANRADGAQHLAAVPEESAGPRHRRRRHHVLRYRPDLRPVRRPTSAALSCSVTTRASMPCATTCQGCGRRGGSTCESRKDVTGAELFARVVELTHDGAAGSSARPHAEPPGRRVPAREDRGRCDRVVHRAGSRPPDAAHRPHRAGLPLDSRGSPDRPRAWVRRVLRGAARPGVNVERDAGQLLGDRPQPLLRAASCDTPAGGHHDFG